MSGARRRVAVIGGGITGLAAAQHLRELDPAIDVSLFEAGARWGGVLRTERIGGYLVEHSADNFLTTPPVAIELCRRIGLGDRLLSTDERNRRASIVHGGQLHGVPEGFMLMVPSKAWPVLLSPLLSWRGKLRLLAERFVRQRRETGDESIASFARRRLGVEAFERLVQPLVGGIYTGNAERLSLAATMPRFVEMERRFGSLTRGALAQRSSQPTNNESGARYGMFVAPADGMQSVVDALVTRLPPESLHLGASVERLTFEPDRRWRLMLAERPAESFDAVILATPAHRAAALIESFAPQAAAELRTIECASSAVCVLGVAEEQIAKPLDGFGFVVPESEARSILSTSFSSRKYAGRAPQGRVLMRVFVGGAQRPDLAGLPDEELKTLVLRELGELIGLRGEPELFRVVRWPKTMPQYHVGHLERVAQIEAQLAERPGLFLAGSAYRGVGIPHCITSAQQAAERIVNGCRDGRA